LEEKDFPRLISISREFPESNITAGKLISI